MKGQFDIFTINLKAYGGEALTKAELDFIETLIFSSDSEKSILANGILFLAGTEKQQRDALKRIDDISQKINFCENLRAKTALVSILEYFPLSELNTNLVYKKFVYQMAKSSFVPCRINAFRVLRQLGKMGDNQAIDLLREGVADSDELVKESAKKALELIGY